MHHRHIITIREHRPVQWNLLLATTIVAIILCMACLVGAFMLPLPDGGILLLGGLCLLPTVYWLTRIIRLSKAEIIE